MDEDEYTYLDDRFEPDSLAAHVVMKLLKNNMHENAMETIAIGRAPLPEGYTFDHYCCSIMGESNYIKETDEAMRFVEQHLGESFLEVTAVYKTPIIARMQGEPLQRPILYISDYGSMFLDGKPATQLDLVRIQSSIQLKGTYKEPPSF